MQFRKILAMGLVSVFFVTNLNINNILVYASDEIIEEVEENENVVSNINSNNISAVQAENSDTEQEMINSALLEMGTPVELLSEYTIEEKKFILENVQDCDAQYLSYEEGWADENSTIKARTVTTNEQLKGKVKFSVTAYRVNKGGKKSIALLPRFKWTSNDEVKNDLFVFSLPQGWEIADDDSSFTLYAYNGNNQIAQIINYTATSSKSYNGVGYTIQDGGTALPNGHYEGMMVAYFEKKDLSASNKMIIKYVHDYSSKSTITYGITYGFLSIGITSNSTKQAVTNAVLLFSYK